MQSQSNSVLSNISASHVLAQIGRGSAGCEWTRSTVCETSLTSSQSTVSLSESSVDVQCLIINSPGMESTIQLFFFAFILL
jgi:hypothetical protein